MADCQYCIYVSLLDQDGIGQSKRIIGMPPIFTAVIARGMGLGPINYTGLGTFVILFLCMDVSRALFLQMFSFGHP